MLCEPRVIRALTFHRLSASTASLHVAPSAGHDGARSYANPDFRAMAGSPLRVKSGHERLNVMSALPPKADMCSATRHVRFVPKAELMHRGKQHPFFLLRHDFAEPPNSLGKSFSLGIRPA